MGLLYGFSIKRFLLGFFYVYLTFATSVYAEEEIIELCSFEHWPPFVERYSSGHGFSSEIIKNAFQSQNIVVVRVWMPWKRAVFETQYGKCDGLTEVHFTEERSEWALFSEAYSSVDVSFYQQAHKNIKFDALSDLETLKIGLVRGALIRTDFDSADFLSKYPVTSLEQGIRMLATGRLDLFIAAELPIEKTLTELYGEEKRYSKIKKVTPTFSKYPLYVAFPKKNLSSEFYREKFNLGLQEIRANGIYEKLAEKYGFDRFYIELSSNY